MSACCGSESIPTPECDRLVAVSKQSQQIGDFLADLQGRGVVLAKYVGQRLAPIQMTTEALLARYFHIDLAEVERERRAILNALRKQQRAK